ncbi:MAG: ABC transporter substrate-binding protein [Clostridia bacterium]|nr:ABC transporter substrate-binding protein [Clostridia bacterium]
MKRFVAMLLVVLMVLTFSTYSLAEEKVVRVSEVTHSVFYAPQYVAINLGMFEKHGLKVELINSQGADKVMTAVLSGQVDIGFAGPEASIYVYLQGKEDYPQVFAQLTQRDGSFLVGREKEENFEWTNLKGMHVLPGRKGGMPYMALMYVIRQNGLDPEIDMNFDNSISFDAMTGAFLGGIGDYVTIFEPTATMVEMEGRGYIVASVGEAAGEIPYTAYFANRSYIENNPDVIQSFVDAIYEGQVWIQTHTAKEIAEVIAPSFPDSDVDVLETVAQRYKDIDAWNHTPIMTKESFERMEDVIEQAGELSSRAPFEAIVTNQYAEFAVSSAD